MEHSSEDSRALALPLLGSVICTGAAVSLFSLPQRASLSWHQLLSFTLFYVGAVACVHASVVWSVCRAFTEHIRRPVWLLVAEIWGCVGWLTFLALLEKERSLWVCAVVPLAVGNSVRFLKIRVALKDRVNEEVLRESRHSGIFCFEETQPAWRALLPTTIIAIATQIGIGAVLADRVWMAGSLFAISAGTLAWRYPFKYEGLNPVSDRHMVLRFSGMYSLFIVALTGAALLPFLKSADRTIGRKELSGFQRAVSLQSSMEKHVGSSSTEYPGVVLLLPPKPHHEIVPRFSSDHLHRTGTLAKPVVIPFDGAYWYFQIPDTRPSPDARIQRGDPLTTSIRSTNRIPIAMEAHQTLTSSVDMNCCRTFQLNLVNADNQEGRIAVEVLLGDSTARLSSPLSLGSIVIPSSKTHFISLADHPINESLNFRFPPRIHGVKFNEITVIVRPDWYRALAGSKVSIQSFVLLP